MKTYSIVRTVTIAFFLILFFGFIAYRSGMFAPENERGYIEIEYMPSGKDTSETKLTNSDTAKTGEDEEAKAPEPSPVKKEKEEVVIKQEILPSSKSALPHGTPRYFREQQTPPQLEPPQ